MDQQITSFLQHLAVEKGFSRNTLEAYRNDLNQFREFLDIRPLQRVNLNLLNEYVSELRGSKGYRDTTIARKVAALSSLFGFLFESGFIAKDPTKSLHKPKVSREPSTPLSLADVTRLLEQAAQGHTPKGRRDAVILELLYVTALQVSELVGLNVADIDSQKSSLQCRGKGSRGRNILLDPQTLASLKQYLDAVRPALLEWSPQQTALFVNHRGERLTRQWVWNIIKVNAAKAGIQERISPNTFRHSRAVHLRQGGENVESIQYLLGHSAKRTTQLVCA